MKLPVSLLRGVVVASALGLCGTQAEEATVNLPTQPFHLTARPWKPLKISVKDYLDAVEGICRFTAQHEDARGAVIDPFLHREHQYSTPYFAVAVGALLHAGRANDLLEAGVRAMDHATEGFAKGHAGITDRHSEFFLAALPLGLELYQGHVSEEKLAQWRDRIRAPALDQLIGSNKNNWRAYGMKGQWRRAQLGLADHDQTVAFIEDAWLHAEQRERIAGNKWNLYEDRGTFPESHAVEGVGRGNLLALVAEGYDGNSSGEMRAAVERGTAVTLFLQDPSGQCPPDGRADDHVWNDVLYQLCFDVMAERAKQAGHDYEAGQFCHAAMLSFASTRRWQRSDGAWAGSFYVTKNHFDPAERVGYQTASNYGNYNGAIMLHLAEAALARHTDIAEQPAPTEIGGYAFATDSKFASAVANAGGMQMFAALRGDTTKVYEHYWTALGVERFARAGWDSRLGPSDGERDPKTGRGVTFAPTWLEDGKWVRLADVPDRYQGKFSVQFTHPLLVRCAIDYSPIKGAGPTFRHEFVLTPDGVFATLHATGVEEFGVTWPLLADDGAPLHTTVGGHFAATAYQADGDDENFLSPGAGAVTADGAERVQSTYGWLLPVRALATDGIQQSFVYPRSPNDPPVARVQASFRVANDGFESSIGSVHGSLYVGRTSAGGEGGALIVMGMGNLMRPSSRRAGSSCNCAKAGSSPWKRTGRRRRTSVAGRFCSRRLCLWSSRDRKCPVHLCSRDGLRRKRSPREPQKFTTRSSPSAMQDFIFWLVVAGGYARRNGTRPR